MSHALVHLFNINISGGITHSLIVFSDLVEIQYYPLLCVYDSRHNETFVINTYWRCFIRTIGGIFRAS